MVPVRAGRTRRRADAGPRSYVDDVLTHKPDEQAVLGSRIGTPTEEMAPFAGDEDGRSLGRDHRPVPKP